MQVPTDEQLDAMAPFAAVAALREAEHAILVKLGAVSATLDEKMACALA